jgi:hypothetical protein
MNRQIKTKINWLMRNAPQGGVLTSAWLTKHAYYKQQVSQYCHSGWLTRIGSGAYTRLNDSVSWLGAVAALQEQLELPVHIGSISALELYGIHQYVAMPSNNSAFTLFNTVLNKVTMPAWFKGAFPHGHYYYRKLFPDGNGVVTKEVNELSVEVSSPERAIMEMFALTPEYVSLKHAAELMEDLNRLRSDVVQMLLESCYSVKVKRLFLCFSDEYQLDFFNKINLESIDLGSGKRVIGKGGFYYPKWQLSLPINLHEDMDMEDAYE